MKQEKITTVKLTAAEGRVLVKVEACESGNYTKENERYMIMSGTQVAAPEKDAKNWQEVESLDAFLKDNGYEEVGKE